MECCVLKVTYIERKNEHSRYKRCILNIDYATKTIVDMYQVKFRGGMGYWVVSLQTRNGLVLGLSSIKGSDCFLELETLPLLLSTGRFDCDFRIKLK